MKLLSPLNRTALLLVVAAASCVAAIAQNPIGFEIKPSLAPNVFGSSYYSTWAGNAVFAIGNGLDQYGDHDTPGFYDILPVNKVRARDLCVTSFYSWRGKVDPGSVFGPQYATEYGNRLHFGVRITGNGTKISISMLSIEVTGDDVDNTLGFIFPTGSYGYSLDYQGIDYGSDGIRGTSDDVVITSGENTQLVDEIVGRGSGNAFWPGAGTTNNFQATIDDYIAALPRKMVVTATYRLTSGGVVIGSGSNSVEIRR